ncbi:MAG: hypothetical protein U0V70_02150 [Terriglobia bacterium]
MKKMKEMNSAAHHFKLHMAGKLATLIRDSDESASERSLVKKAKVESV